MIAELDVLTPDGRTLRVSDAGDASGPAVLVMHGSPGSGLLNPDDVSRARRKGFRVLSYDRPGYGRSSRLEGRDVAGCAADVRAIAGALGIARMGVWGISAGGPHAAACGARLGDLVPAVALLGSVAPYGAPGLDYFAGMGESNVEDVKLLLEDPKRARAKFEADRRAMLVGDPGEMLATMRSVLVAPDAAALATGLGSVIIKRWTMGLAPGADGWFDDVWATIKPWKFELNATKAAVLVVHGRQDGFVPIGHSEWLAAAIPGAEARFYDDEGHLSLLANRVDEVEDWLLDRL